jgi:hypothetical protein
MKKIVLYFLVSAALIACTNQGTKTTNNDDANIKKFKENTKIVEAALIAFAIHDLKEWASYHADSVKWHSASYGQDAADTSLNMSAVLSRLEGFHKIVKNITVKVDGFVPGLDTATFKPDGSVRAYIRWSGESASNGSKISQKYYCVYTFNENHKIVDVDEYFDATGTVQAAIAPKK